MFRFVAGFSQYELGRRAGVDQAVISRAENGFRVSVRARGAIARALGVDVKLLFPDLGERS